MEKDIDLLKYDPINNEILVKMDWNGFYELNHDCDVNGVAQVKLRISSDKPTMFFFEGFNNIDYTEEGDC